MKLWEPTDDDGNPKADEAVYQFTVKVSVVAREGQTGESTAWLTDATRPDGSANPLAELPLAQYLLANPDKTLKNLYIFRSPFGESVSLREFLETAAPSVITTKYSCFLPICGRFKVALKGLVRSDAYKRLVWSQWVDAIELVAIPKRDAAETVDPEERDQLEAMYAPPRPPRPPPVSSGPPHSLPPVARTPAPPVSSGPRLATDSPSARTVPPSPHQLCRGAADCRLNTPTPLYRPAALRSARRGPAT